jgi:RNA polymerase sigma factor (sigma-70 family)
VSFINNISSGANSKGSSSSATPSGAEEDLELIAAYRQSSDLAILGKLYQRYLDLLFGVCLKYLGERETAKDAVMEIFEELAQKLLKHEVTHFKGWLYTLARNHCLMQLRSSAKIKTSPFDPELMQTAEELHLTDKIEKEARLVWLASCIESLSAEQKVVVSLFYLENKCYKEIAAITGQDWNKVRSLVQNGRRNLRICMQRQETEAESAESAVANTGMTPGIRKADPEGKDPALAI